MSNVPRLSRRRLLQAGAVTGLAATGLPVLAQKSFTMKLSTPTLNDMQHEWANLYKAELEKRTAGRIKVQVYPAAQLGPIDSVIQGLQLGTIEATLTPYEFYSGVDPRYQVPGMPGLFNSMEDAQAKLTHPKVREQLMALGKAKGLVGLASIVYGPQIFVLRQPATALNDLARRKIRVLASELEVNALKAIGAAPVPLPLNEVASALQQGAIDGANNLMDVLVPQKMYSFAPHVLDTRLWYTVVHASVSAAWLNSLPADLQQAVLDTARELEPVIFARQLERRKNSEKQWVANGGRITALPAADSQRAQELTNGVAERVLASNPAMKQLHELIRTAAAS
jgi:TRAP-type C4-dicarboxylate transport system substrate-binding protein